MTLIYYMPESKALDHKYSQLTKRFIFFSDIVGMCVIPTKFICDWESIPFFKGTSKVSGLIHDYLCRKNSIPVVSKKVAADVYLEFMKYRGTSRWRRYLKYWGVRLAWGYFHRFKVLDDPR